jgi:hypothetical protein
VLSQIQSAHDRTTAARDKREDGMSGTDLHEFVRKVLSKDRIGFGDLRRLQRDVLPNGITARDEAEALIELDRSVTRVEEGWPGYLAAAVKDFVVSNSNPTGCIDRGTAEWLLAILSRTRTKTGLAIAREIVLEADQVDDVLLAFARQGPKRKPRPSVSNLECA